MANRYWVGGTGTWNTTSTTNWSASSGGAGGASVPTAADSVFFDQAGTYTVTMTGALTCLDFTGSAGTVTFATGTTPTLAVSGSFALAAGTVWSSTGTITFNATSGAKTVSTNGITLSAPITFSGAVATSHTLSSALTTTGAITITSGEFHTNTTYNYSVTAASIVMSGINAKLTLNGSTVTLSSTTPLDFTAATSPLLNFNYSTVVFTGAVTSFAPININVTFASVQFTNTTARTLAFTSTSTYTFGSLSIAAPAAIGVTTVTLAASIITYGLITTGTAGNRRVLFRGATYGLSIDIFLNGSGSNVIDADFRDIYVNGTNVPLTGTRLGDLGGCSGIMFSTPKTVYWNLPAGGSWTDNAWAASSGGTVSTDNFPLAQDTGVISNTGLNTGATVATPSATTLLPVGTLNASTRTLAMTLQLNASTHYGDFVLGSGVTMSNASPLTFSGRSTQTITSAGKTFSGNITVDSFGGTLQLADALNIGTNTITVTNGTFDTKNYSVTAATLASSNSNVRTINLGSSTVTLSNAVDFTTSTNFGFDCGTSTIIFSASSTSPNFGGKTFYNLSFTSTNNSIHSILGGLTCNNLNVSPPASAGLRVISVGANFTVNGTLTVAGGTAVSRIFLRSDTLGTQRDLTVGTLVASDCDFRDIEILGTAIGAAPIRAGNCGGNNNITFPAPKTVYWNLGNSQSWSATAWASSSGGTPAVNNFPLAQDTAVFDNTFATGISVTLNTSWNIGSVDMSARTTNTLALVTTAFTYPCVYGDWTFGTGVTCTSSAGKINFIANKNQTIRSNGVSFNSYVNFGSDSSGTSGYGTYTVSLADAFSNSYSPSAITTSHNGGTFDAVSYNVTTLNFSSISANPRTLNLGSGTWTLTGTGTGSIAVWYILAPSLTLLKGTANFVLSSSSTNAREFAGAGLSYNKLTIGGTGVSASTTISGNNQFTELASTKTVAHTIALGTTTQTFGKWSVTGTVNNVVTVTGTGTSHVIAGERVTGVNYLSMGTLGFAATSPGEFYAGANSIGSGAGVIKTAAPTPTTRYWVGGLGTWSDTLTTNWSDSSGGPSGASVPTSADAVVFDSASYAGGSYTVTCTATQLRCASLTMSGPASGSVTWAGTAPLAIHGNVSLAATGVTRTYTGAITLTGSTTGKTFTTNGVSLGATITVNGVGCGWSLGSALSTAGMVVTNGEFNTQGYALTFSSGSFASSNANTRTVSFGSSVITLPNTPSIEFTNPINLSFNSGTSTIVASLASNSFRGGGQTFYNVSFSNTAITTASISGKNTFNNLSIAGRTSAGLAAVSFLDDQTINGTLTLSAGANASTRTVIQSDTLGSTRTLTCAAVSATDIDFQDITITGAAAPVSGTRLGNCHGNSGIQFDAPKTVYWGGFTSTAINANLFALSIGGATSVNNFPLAQDTLVFPSAYPDNSNRNITMTPVYNLGTVDTSARLSGTSPLTLPGTLNLYGNLICGSGTSITAGVVLNGRGNTSITSPTTSYGSTIEFKGLGGTITLQNNLTATGNVTLTYGTLNLNNKTLTCPAFIVTNNNMPRGLDFSSTSTLSLTSTWSTTTLTNFTVAGTGKISILGGSFQSPGFNYGNVTLDINAATVTVSGSNYFKNITNSYSTSGNTLSLSGTTQILQQFTAAGSNGKLLTITGSPATLILTGPTDVTSEYLKMSGIRMYSRSTGLWKLTKFTNLGTFGTTFVAAVVKAVSNFFAFF